MIATYNRKELAWAVLSAVGAAVCYGLAFAFFRFSFWFVTDAFGYPQWRASSSLAAATALVVVTFSGYWTWRQRGGFSSYEESGLYHRLGKGEFGSAYMVGRHVHRVTGNAYLLSQLFLSGPLLALRALSHLHNRIPYEPGLEGRLHDVLEKLRQANRWQGEEDHRDALREILLLARMRQIDFSVAKGSARFKAAALPTADGARLG